MNAAHALSNLLLVGAALAPSTTAQEVSRAEGPAARSAASALSSLQWSTFLGEVVNERVQDVALAANGDIVVCGDTSSPAFPTTPGAFATTKGAGFDVFVARLDPDATGSAQLVYGTFLGGSGNDLPNSISVDDQGVITVVGRTASGDFPTTASAVDTTHNGGNDAFVARLDPSKAGAAQLVYSTFLGGAQDDSANDHHVDGAGVVTVAGWTASSAFPVTAGAYASSYGGGASDLLVFRLDPSQAGTSGLLYASFLGGSGREDCSIHTLAVDPNGVVTLAGRSSSTDYPTTPGAFQSTNAGGDDGVVSRLDPSRVGSAQLLASTYVGGTGNEFVSSATHEGSGRVTVAGSTFAVDFPVTAGAYQTVFGATGGYLGFVSAFDEDLATLQASTYLGGTAGAESLNVMRRGPSGLVTVAGAAGSGDFPTTPGAFLSTFQGGAADAFVTRLSPDLDELFYSTYLGGGADVDYAYTATLGDDLSVVAAGLTRAADYPTTPGAYSTTFSNFPGAADGMLTKLDMLPTGARLVGDPTPGCRGPSAIGVTSMPVAGGAGFRVLASNAPANGLGWLGLSSAAYTTPLHYRGVEVWIDLARTRPLIAVTADADGYCEVSLPVPAGTAGFQGYAQFLWRPDASCGAGFSSSAALELTIQP